MRQRKQLRLKDYDYRNDNAYFVTVCVKEHKKILGTINKQNVILNEFGKIVDASWTDLTNHYKNILLGEYIVMPNHFHGILIIDNNLGLRADLNSAPTQRCHGLPEFIRAFKSFSTRKIKSINNAFSMVWQRGYYDRIIRNENELQKIQEYIINNPINWDEDEYNPKK
jgi:putative transposase